MSVSGLKTTAIVRKWPEGEVPPRRSYVRFRMHCRSDVLAVSFSAHDPNGHLSLSHVADDDFAINGLGR